MKSENAYSDFNKLLAEKAKEKGVDVEQFEKVFWEANYTIIYEEFEHRCNQLIEEWAEWSKE